MSDYKPTRTHVPAEEQASGYTFEGKEIILRRSRGRPKKFRNKMYFPQDKKVQACTMYAVYGNVDEVAKLTDVPPEVLRTWKQEPWWIEILKQIYVEQNEGLGSKINNVLDKTLVHLEDRLTAGDYIYNQKTGETIRKPVDTKVLAMLFDNLAVQRRLNRGEPTSISANIGVEDRLTKMKQEFENFAKTRQIEGVVISSDITEV